jgi:enamine deaminase RidA (YjgF/YER057c/UK114 family)
VPAFDNGRMNRTIDTGVAAHVGPYSDGIEVGPGARWLVTAGTVGIRPDGTLPETFEEQAVQAWEHVLAALAGAQMTADDLVKVTQYLVRATDLGAYRAVRARFMPDARPASTLVIVAALARPEWLIEIEAAAARP